MLVIVEVPNFLVKIPERYIVLIGQRVFYVQSKRHCTHSKEKGDGEYLISVVKRLSTATGIITSKHHQIVI